MSLWTLLRRVADRPAPGGVWAYAHADVRAVKETSVRLGRPACTASKRLRVLLRSARFETDSYACAPDRRPTKEPVCPASPQPSRMMIYPVG